jgi:hypothetical protein
MKKQLEENLATLKDLLEAQRNQPVATGLLPMET